MGKFASSGVKVAQLAMSRREKALQHQKGNKVTMGNGVPRQREGAVGDITVRKITTGDVNLRVYIKTDSGWIDVNSMQGAVRVVWIDMVLDNNWVHHGATQSTPSYFKDSNGFVHLRGAVKNGDAATDVITNMPDGFRPILDTHRIILDTSGTSVSQTALLKIEDDGDLSAISGSTTGLFLDGVSYYAGQTVTGAGGGTSSGGSGSGSSGSSA